MAKKTKDEEYDVLAALCRKNDGNREYESVAQRQKLVVNHNYFMRRVVLAIFTILEVGIIAGLVMAICSGCASAAAESSSREGAIVLYGLALMAGIAWLIVVFVQGSDLRELHEKITEIEDLRIKDSFHALSEETLEDSDNEPGSEGWWK